MEITFGALIFDDPSDPGSGWAAIANKKAVKVSGLSELPTDTIWWTNAIYDTFWRQTEIWRNAYLKHDKYLVISPVGVLKEWGRDPNLYSNDFLAELSAKAFNRIMRMAWNLIRDVDPKAKIAEVFSGKTLRDDMRCLLPEIDYPKGEAATVMKRGAAWEEFTPVISRRKKGSKIFMLRRPRVSYAIEMLQTPVPKGPFEFVPRRQIETNKTQWALDNDRPLMVEVKVNKMAADIAPVYGFGNSLDKNTRMLRSWVAHPEFIALNRYADVEVRNAWIGAEYWAMMPEFPSIVTDFLNDAYTSVSWSAGIIAETLWRAIALGQSASVIQALGEDRAMTSWPGAWVRAMDKTSMFASAFSLVERGHTVVSYGLGWVQCSILEQDAEQLIRDGLSIGLLPNALDVPPGMFTPYDAPWGGDDKTKPYAKFSLVRDDDLLWKLDQIPLLQTRSERDMMVKRLMTEAKASKSRGPG